MTYNTGSLLRELECPSCGAPVKYKEGDSVAICEYCGSKAALDTHRTIHIVDEARIKEIELQRDIMRQEQKTVESKKTERKKFNRMRAMLIAAGLVGFAAKSISPIFTIMYLGAIFCGVIVLPPMNPDKEKLMAKIYERGAFVSHKSRAVAFCLCFFLGWLGVHRFYAGKIGTGILYIFTIGLFGIGWLVDLIKIAAGKFEEKNGAVIFE
ncbi:MAG: TM2 domain-containing protein [Eubacteriales bacterium]|nr:TM2 domain-containing protein [Eubacteriales bacterium]